MSDMKESFSDREKRVLAFWKEHQIFQKSLDERRGGPFFNFYDGPPFATGLPHYGHLLAGTIKDVVPRYKTMKGFCVPRRFGWDCHGLPIENEIEKNYHLSGALDIEAFGVDCFNEACREIVLRYTGQWRETVERMGRFVDFDNTYRTMDRSFMESVWWVFQQLYEKGLVYEGFKVMPFSAKLGTPLSNFEANANYKEVDDPSLIIAFEWLKAPGTYFLAWTTTPWTLPSNLALMVQGEAEYVKVAFGGLKYVVAKSRVHDLFRESVEVLASYRGRDLVGIQYRPLFSYFVDRKGFYVIEEPGVSVEEGTGVVHAAPAFGELDFYACGREGIELVCPVDQNGHFTKEVEDYQGLWVKEADKKIIRDLKNRGLVFAHGTIRHRYPFCWRSDSPLIYKAVTTWFVAVEKIKEKLVEVNQSIHWVPEHIRDGRFGKWLEQARDWAISRNRYWGTPIPIWRHSENDWVVLGSVRELEEKTGQKIQDLHRHHIDHLTFEIDGKVYRRVPEVFDCWFESGSMPYAQLHYPFEGEKDFVHRFPAHFIAEGLDQTRGWFYTLIVLGVALFDRPAFFNVVVNGIILAEDGTKMSKKLKNYPDPNDVIELYGADAVRLYMLQSAAVRGEDLSFSEKGVEQTLRQVLIPLWNAYHFFSTYAKIYNWSYDTGHTEPQTLMDRWILSRLAQLIEEVEQGMDRYDLDAAVAPFVGFVDSLTNWYIRRSRGRFWADEDTRDRRGAFATLYEVLKTVSKVAAPFIPFLSEAIYQELRVQGDPLSVHLCLFPQQGSFRCLELEDEMRGAQLAVSIGHALRKEHRVKVRQPLSKAYLVTKDGKLAEALRRQKGVIQDELNVKEVIITSNESEFVFWRGKPCYPVLGKKVGKNMPQVARLIQEMSFELLEQIALGSTVVLDLAGEELTLASSDVQVERCIKEGRVAGNEGALTVALDLALDETLLLEGLAREMINKINTMRREQGLAVTDRVIVTLETTPRVKQAFLMFEDFIVKEVLAVDVYWQSTEGVEWDLNGEFVRIHIEPRRLV
jgi:isoleucyl-tRNA synthetase